MLIYKKENKTVKLFILSLVFVLCLGSFASAESVAVDVIYSANNDFSGVFYQVVGSQTQASINSYSMDFNTIAAPTDLIWLTNTLGSPLSQTGSFSYTSGTTVIQGTYQISNGSFSGYTGQVYLHFTTFNKGTATGIQYITLSGIPALSTTRFNYVGGTLTGLTPVYVQSPEHSEASGVYVLRDTAYGKNTFYADDNGGTQVVTTHISRYGYSSSVKIFSGTTEVYSAGLSTIDIPNFILLQKPLTFQSTMFGHAINSSEYFIGNTSYDYTLSDYDFPISQNPTGTLTGINLATVKFYKVTDATPNAPRPIFFDSNNEYAYNFLKNTTRWNAYTLSGGYSKDMGVTMPNSLPLKFYNGGVHTLRIDVIDTTGLEQTIYKNVTVQGAGVYTVSVYPMDYQGNNFVSGATVAIQNYNTKVWTNKTVISPQDCMFLLDTGFYKFTASAPNYLTQDNGLIYISSSRIEQIILYPAVSTSTGDIINSTAYIKVQTEPNLYPLSGAVVSITPSNLVTTTAASGVSIFNLINGTTYKATVQAQGYTTLSEYFTPNAANYYFNIVLTKTSDSGGFGTIDTSIPTPTITPLPITTPASWSNGSATTCQILTGQNVTTLQYMKNLAACNGFETGISQSLIIAGLIILLCVGYGARYGKGVGAAIGGIIGFVLSFALGIIPFVVLALIIVLLVLVIAILVLARAGTGG